MIIKSYFKYSKFPNEECWIVFDGKGLNKLLRNDKIGLLCGVRHHLLLRLKKTFDELKLYGIKIAFFRDGHGSKNNRKKHLQWFDRQNKTYKTQIEIFDKIIANEPVVKILSSADELDSEVYDLTGSTNALTDICKKYDYYHKSFSNDPDAVLAQFASRMNAMAVIAQDSDLIIFERTWQYWSVKCLNLQELTTLEYSRSALRKYVFLTQQQMHLWASLVGNDIIDYHLATAFHRHLGDAKYKFKNVAKYVRQQKIQNMEKSELQSIIDYGFGSNSVVTTDLLAESIKSYDINAVKYIPDKLSESPLNQLAFGCSDLHAFLIDIPYVNSYKFFDFRQSEFLPYTCITEPIILRQMGISLQHKKDPAIKRTIFYKPSHDEPYTEKNVTPAYPTRKFDKLILLNLN